MPLPTAKQEWPPEEWRGVFDKYAEWAAWYSSDPTRLASVYSGLVYTPTPRGRFWAKEVKEERQTMLHVPIAADMATVSADLLFAEEPDIRISEAHEEDAQEGAKEAQDRLDEILAYNEAHGLLVEIGETAAALGGCFAKINWDRERYDFPLLSVAQADAALPVFRWGFLQEVTFYKVVAEESRHGEMYYYRHVEHHEPGLIQNRLFRGTLRNIGREVPLEATAYTRGLDPDIETGIDDLLVRYIPNKRPNRLWRGSALGQSDYGGLEGLMDSLDETFTSWMRDLRMARARIVVPESFLEFHEQEGEFFFDLDKSVFVGLNMGPASEDQDITPSQFAIRSAEHRDTALELLDRIIGSAGYSPQSFGLQIEGRAESGTALRLRERKSLKTKQKKQRHMQRALEELCELALTVDREILGSTVEPFRPRIGFGDSIPDDPTETAQAVQRLHQAEAASVDTKVRMLHPEWGEEEVQAEVERIRQESGMVVDDPEVRV